jgi:hypothetical protein
MLGAPVPRWDLGTSGSRYTAAAAELSHDLVSFVVHDVTRHKHTMATLAWSTSGVTQLRAC